MTRMTFNPRLPWKQEDETLYKMTQPCLCDVEVYGRPILFIDNELKMAWYGLIDGTERELRLTSNTFAITTAAFETPRKAMCHVEEILAREGLVEILDPHATASLPEHIKAQIAYEFDAQIRLDALIEQLINPSQKGEEEPISLPNVNSDNNWSD